MKNFKYSKIMKIIMFIATFAMVFGIFVYSGEILKIKPMPSGSDNSVTVLLKQYDEQYGTDYYTPYYNVKSELYYALKDDGNLEIIANDTTDRPIHEILGVDIADDINAGVRYVIIDDEDNIIGSDGVSDGRGYENNVTKSSQWFYEYNEYDSIDYRLYTYYDESIAKEISGYASYINNQVFRYGSIIAICGLIIILLGIYFGVVSGKKRSDDDIIFSGLDRVYIDFRFWFDLIAISMLLSGYLYINSGPWRDLSNVFLILASILITIIIISFSSNVGKKLRTRKFFDSISIVAFCKYIKRKIISPLAKVLIIESTISLKIVIGLIVVLLVLALLSIAAGLYFVTELVVFILIFIAMILCFNSIRLINAIRKVKDGKSYEAEMKVLNIPYNSAFEDVEYLSKNMSEIYKEGETAQKVKTELISNVSHDLRTPLTSIIGYVDLLEKNNEQYDEETNEYIKILKEKSERMNTMVEDLFDLAKSASGDVKLQTERLNVKNLIDQTLNELDDVISDEKIIKRLDESLYIRADGNKMYRVIQNLIENAVKYSFEGTRIYIDAYAIEKSVFIEFKNISNYQMDFTSEEIVQRFNRGDKSRSTKGSGLGLSIAKTYTNLNGGEFRVDVDGDMFKVVLEFGKTQ